MFFALLRPEQHGPLFADIFQCLRRTFEKMSVLVYAISSCNSLRLGRWEAITLTSADTVFQLYAIRPQWVNPSQCPFQLLFNTLVPGRCSCKLKLVIFKRQSRTDLLTISIDLMWMPHLDTSSGNSLVLSGKKPWHEPMLTQVLWCCMVSLGHNEFKFTLWPEQNGQHFADHTFKWILFTWNFCVLIKFLCSLSLRV